MHESHARPAGPVRSGRSTVQRVMDRMILTLSLAFVGFVVWVYLLFNGFFDSLQVQTASTVFVAIVVQALPFLVLGTAVSGAISAFVTPAMLSKVLPGRPGLAVPAAGALGMLLPGCECASVPVARRLITSGVVPAAALTFMLAAPAVNPVVLVATAVAFPDRPAMVAARFVASMTTAVLMGWFWLRRGDETALVHLVAQSRTAGDSGASGGRRWVAFAEETRSDLVQAGGYLVIGAALAAFLGAVVPQSRWGFLAGVPLLSVVFLAGLAVIIAVCSEADAFIASSLTQFSPTAQLAFMVVGPAVDLKLFALQTGSFGGRFSTRFAPLTFAVALASAAVTGVVLL